MSLWPHKKVPLLPKHLASRAEKLPADQVEKEVLRIVANTAPALTRPPAHPWAGATDLAPGSMVPMQMVPMQRGLQGVTWQQSLLQQAAVQQISREQRRQLEALMMVGLQ